MHGHYAKVMTHPHAGDGRRAEAQQQMKFCASRISLITSVVLESDARCMAASGSGTTTVQAHDEVWFCECNKRPGRREKGGGVKQFKAGADLVYNSFTAVLASSSSISTAGLSVSCTADDAGGLAEGQSGGCCGGVQGVRRRVELEVT